jgi:hypothetical protein
MKGGACELGVAVVGGSLDDDDVDCACESRRVQWGKIFVVLVGCADCIYSAPYIIHDLWKEIRIKLLTRNGPDNNGP